MATVVIDSFDHYTTTDIANGLEKWSYDSGCEIQSGGARTGDQCLKLPAGGFGTSITKLMVASSIAAFGAGFKLSALPSADTRLVVFGSNAAESQTLRIYVSPDGNLIAKDRFDVVLAASVQTVSAGQWIFIDVEQSGANFTVEAYRGSGAEAFLSGSGALAAPIDIAQVGDAGTSIDIFVDDAYLNDDSGGVHVGKMGGDQFRVHCLRTISSDTSQWTPNTGTNLSCVSDITPDGDTTYNESTNSGDRDLYEMTQGLLGTSQVVQIVPCFKGTIGSTVGCTVKIGGTEYPSTAGVAAGIYEFLNIAVLNLNPATGLEFTATEIDAARWGYYLDAAGFGGARATQFVIEVVVPFGDPSTSRVRNFCF